MKALAIAVYSVCLTATLTLGRADDTTKPEEHKKPAVEHKKPALTEEQKEARKELIAKYDANKDGKLDREEMKKISDEDKEKAKKAGLGPQHRPKKAEKTEKK